MSAVVPKSALVVVVSEAEAAVGSHREGLDVNASLDVPAHVTVLFPFVPAAQIDATVLGRLRELFARAEPFDYCFSSTAWFGEEVLWLAPDDPRPFRGLTQGVHHAFPEYPPFEGEFEEVVPHLTVGHGHDVEDLRAAERAVSEHLPINGRATEVVLLTQSRAGGTWARTSAFPLGHRC